MEIEEHLNSQNRDTPYKKGNLSKSNQRQGIDDENNNNSKNSEEHNEILNNEKSLRQPRDLRNLDSITIKRSYNKNNEQDNYIDNNKNIDNNYNLDNSKNLREIHKPSIENNNNKRENFMYVNNIHRVEVTISR